MRLCTRVLLCHLEVVLAVMVLVAALVLVGAGSAGAVRLGEALGGAGVWGLPLLDAVGGKA